VEGFEMRAVSTHRPIDRLVEVEERLELQPVKRVAFDRRDVVAKGVRCPPLPAPEISHESLGVA
jgi:hypothetical protein